MKIRDYFHEFIFGIGKVIMYIFMALSTKVRSLAIFQLITDTSQNSKANITPLTFFLFHLWLKHNKGILFLNIWINAILTIQPDILKDNHMVTAIHVPIKVWSAKDNSEILDLSLIHWKLVQIGLVAVFDVFD